MKVLWITTVPFPDACKALNIEAPVVGGWIHSSAMALLEEYPAIELAVATFFKVNELKTITKKNIKYFLIPRSKRDNESCWKYIHNHFLPDVVHIHGTEYGQGLAYIRIFGNKNVVASIQGLVSVYVRYYFGGIDKNSLRVRITPRDILRRDSVFQQYKKLSERGKAEVQTIKSLRHIMGRTLWDKIHSLAINHSIQYHFCNEILRNEFYKHEWRLEGCEQYSIFLSQGHYPLKGLHMMIEAMPLILKHYPQAKMYISGNDFFNVPAYRLNGYYRYIKSVIEKNKLIQYIFFLGPLSEKEMCKRFLKSNVFVCPSSIENSPNSVGEAQLLGVPCIASYAGGIPDMIENEITGLLYRFEETEMLAYNICRLFADKTLAETISKNETSAALKRHDVKQNSKKLLEIYNSINNE